MNAHSDNRRTNRMIDPGFQRGITMRVGGMALFYFLFCLFVSVALPIAIAVVTNERDAALAQVAFRLEVMFKVMLAPLAVTFIALWIQGMQETFRIAGPNYRFKVVMAQLRDRCIPRGVKIREDDSLKDTARAFDEALVVLHDDVDRLKREASRAVEAVHSCGPHASRGSHQQAVDAVERVAASLERFELVGCAPACEPLVAEAVEEPVETAEHAPISS